MSEIEYVSVAQTGLFHSPTALNHNLHLSEIQKEQLEQEIVCINKEKADILEQLQHINRQKNALAEDLILAKKDIERLSENHLRLTKEKEELNKERNNLCVELTSCERENRKQTEINASLKSDKECLESALYEAQQQVAQLEARKEQLEAENQELLIRKENTQAEVNRLHKELEIEIEKAARQRDALNQKFLIFEQEANVSCRQKVETPSCVSKAYFFFVKP